MTSKVIERYCSYLKELPNGCIVWTGALDNNGHGHFYLGQKVPGNWNRILIGAHVFAYILHYKEYPTGDVHHKCEEPSCCNPLHMEEKSHWKHISDHRTKEFCQAGHELAVVGQTKSRNCRECQKIYNRKYYQKRKA